MSSPHWWENYAVRYFVGTVVGAGAILMFNEYSASPLKAALFPAISNFKDAGAQHLVILGALGLAYCYLASAPMLAIHALRGEIKTDQECKLTSFTPVFLFFILLATIGLHLSLPIHWLSWQSFAIGFVGIVLALQLALLLLAVIDRFNRVSDYYRELSKFRASESVVVKEYVESYRHLREHGNAFCIVVLELGFAMACIAVPSLALLAGLLTLWVLPACAVWLVGTVLEGRLKNVQP